MSHRLLAVGWDGVDAALVDELVSAGRLPVLASLRHAGATVAVRPLPGLGDDAHWASFATGLPPGVHGRFHHVQPNPGRYTDRHFDRKTMSVTPFWQHLDALGRKVAVVDVPKSPMATLTHGVEITDWMVHGPDGPEVRANTAELAQQWVQRWPNDPGFDCDIPKRSEAILDDHWELLQRRRARRTAALEEMVRSGPPDLMLAVYAEGHCASHHLWHRPEAVREMLEALDADLGRLIAATDGPPESVAVFGLVGMTADTTAGDVIEAALQRLEPSLMNSRLSLERTIRTLARRPIPDPKHRQRRAVYPLPHDALSTPIRINLAGREPYGMVKPGRQLQQLQARLTEELLALTDADTGTPIVTEVVMVSERYPGPRSDRFADLLACWDVTEPHRSAVSPTLGRIDVERPLRRTGDHRGGGWLTYAAPDRSLPPPGELEVMDLAPLLSGLCG